MASACEAARVHPEGADGPAHDAFSRLLARLEPDAATLWAEVEPHVRRPDGILIVDDTVLDKPYARKRSWAIEEYHRGLKQYTHVERCSARRTRSQRNHIGFALRAFVRLEWHRFHTGVSWFEAKWSVIREAVRTYLSDPRYRLPGEATA